MLTELLAHPGVEEICELRSAVGVMAFHGGLEPNTEVIGAAVAERLGASFYAVVQPKGFRWHVPSNAFTPEESSALAAFIDRVDVAVAVHGYWRREIGPAVLLGGSNRDLARAIGDELRARPAIELKVFDDLDEIPIELRGVHPDNPVNRPTAGGVQVELTPKVRDAGPRRDALIDGISTGIAAYGARRSTIQPSGVRR